MKACTEQWAETACSSLKLSVVIITYNYASVLSRALNSVVEQLNADCELLVVDDGSADETLGMLKQYAVPSDCRACYLTQENAGPAAARNHALRHARGRWVLFLDADDELEKGAIGPILNKLEAEPDLDLLVGGHTSRFADGRQKYHPPSAMPDAPEQRLVDYLLHKRIGMSHGSSIFRRERVQERPYPENLRQSEDLAVFAYMLSCPQVATLDQSLAIIHKHADSLRHNVKLALNNTNQIAESVFEKLPAYMQRHESDYRAQRALSAFRICYKGGYREEALACYAQARQLAPGRALRWAYLSKWIKLKLSR